MSVIAFATVFVWSLTHVHMAVVFLATSLAVEYLVQARGRRIAKKPTCVATSPLVSAHAAHPGHAGTTAARSQQRVADMLAPALVHSVRSAEDTE